MIKRGTYRVRYVFIVLMCMSMGAASVHATNYTARPSAKSNATSPKKAAPVQTCSAQDKADIRNFNREARSLKKKYNGLLEDLNEARSERQAERIQKDLSKLSAFYKSDIYVAMKEIYDGCDVRRPTLGDPLPFWMPDSE